MATSNTTCLTHLPGIPLEAICEHLDTQGLEDLFDVLVRQQALNKKTGEDCDIPELRHVIKKAYKESKESKEIALWQEFLVLVPIQTLCEALQLPADSTIDSHEKALKLKRALAPDQPFSSFKEEVIRLIASDSSQRFTNEGLLLIFQGYAAKPSPLSDHILTILIKDHNLLERLLSMFDSPRQINYINKTASAIQERHRAQEGINGLCSQLAATSLLSKPS